MKTFSALLTALLTNAGFTAAAFAQDAVAPASPTNGLASMLPLILIFFVFYFLVIRPQSKKMKQHQEMVTSLKKGDKVITGGGIYGSITKVHDNSDTIDVEITTGVVVKVVKSTVISRPDQDVTKPATAPQPKK